MQKIATLFKHYALWLQAPIIFMLLLLLLFSPPSAPQRNSQGYLQMLNSLALPYLISGDRNGLQQSLDLIIQNTPILDARLLNTENRPLVQVINRSAQEESRNAAEQHSTELVLDQTLLGTLSISMPAATVGTPNGARVLAALALLLGIGRLLASREPADTAQAEKTQGKATRQRHLIAISLAPLIERMKQNGVSANPSRLQLFLTIMRRLAPSYGLEYIAVADEILFLQSNSDDKQGLRQAIVFTWNTCQSLGIDRGLGLRGTICTVELSSDPMISNLSLIAEDQIDLCSDLLAGNAAGTVSFSQNLATTLPNDWTVQWEHDKQHCLINELPASVCRLWRRQLSSLTES